MSERRTAEIKFRCTPTFKSGVQAAADAAGQSVTEYIEAAVWAAQNARLGLELLDQARVLDLNQDVPQPKVLEAGTELQVGWNTPPVIPVESLLDAEDLEVIRLDAAPEDDEPCACRPWEFCTHKAQA